MSSFTCEHCGKDIVDTDRGYIIGCEHYPIEPKPRSGYKRHKSVDICEDEHGDEEIDPGHYNITM